MDICEKELRGQRRLPSIIMCIAFTLKLTHFPQVQNDVIEHIGAHLAGPKQGKIRNLTITANCKPVHPKFREMFTII